MDEQAVIKALAALAQPLRLQAFRALVVLGQEGMTPGTMAEGLDIPAAKLRATIEVPVSASREEIERVALAEPKVAGQLAGATPKKVIVVPGKIINVVV